MRNLTLQTEQWAQGKQTTGAALAMPLMPSRAKSRWAAPRPTRVQYAPAAS